MKFHCTHFRVGIILTAILAVTAIIASDLPVLGHLGVLTTALLLGLVVRALLHIPQHQQVGIGFSAKQLLRLGIVLLGIRLNFALLAHAGIRIVLLDMVVITVGLVTITWLGRMFGLRGYLPILLAVDSSICGASAVAAVAPVLKARDQETALVIPVGSLIGTAGVLGLTFTQHYLPLPAPTFGILAGSSLHEVAQVLAASASVTNALDSGTLTKLIRVVMLGPVVVLLGALFQTSGSDRPSVQGMLTFLKSLWFVFGFLAVGALNTFLNLVLPSHAAGLAALDTQLLTIGTFLMAMAMAGLGLQVDFAQLRTYGLRVAGAGILGWLFLLVVARGLILVLGL